MRNISIPAVLMLLIWLVCLLTVGPVYAADGSGDYLTYQEPKPAAVSWLSTIAYVFSLIITFAVVIGLAYYTSRFLGRKMGQMSPNGGQKIITILSLGQNRAVYVVEIAGKYLVLGVTEHNINLLMELTDTEQIAAMRQQPAVSEHQFESVFQRQLMSLQQMSQKFPTVFDRQREQPSEHEKR